MSRTRIISAVARRVMALYSRSRQRSELTSSLAVEALEDPVTSDTTLETQTEELHQGALPSSEEPALSMSPQTAAQQVFAIPELVEQILLSSSRYRWRHLFKIQRVNSTFRDIITTSIHLRRRMFLEYESGPPCPNARFTTVLADLYHSRFFETWPFQWGITTSSSTITVIKLYLTMPITRYERDSAITVKAPESETSQTGPQGSWRGIRLSHTPRRVRVLVDVEYQSGRVLSGGSVEFAAGDGDFGSFVEFLDEVRKKVYAAYYGPGEDRNGSRSKGWRKLWDIFTLGRASRR